MRVQRPDRVAWEAVVKILAARAALSRGRQHGAPTRRTMTMTSTRHLRSPSGQWPQEKMQKRTPSESSERMQRIFRMQERQPQLQRQPGRNAQRGPANHLMAIAVRCAPIERGPVTMVILAAAGCVGQQK